MEEKNTSQETIVRNYTSIQGWFDYEDVFDEIIEKLSSRSATKIKIVEVGAWLGKSTFYLVDHYGKKAEIYTVDTWRGSHEELNTTHHLATTRDIFVDFMKNMRIHIGRFTPLRLLSTDAAEIFDDNSIDFIFIDGDHSYDAVRSDLIAWVPKLTTNGIIAGHDYRSSKPGVKAAVDEFFGRRNIVTKGRSWIFQNK